MKRIFSGVLAAAAALALSAGAAAASPLFEPDSTWATMETPHFRIYYQAPLAHKVQQIADIAEDAHRHLAPYMQVEPAGPTEVILADGYDVLNSMAHNSPHRAVWLWQTPPNPDEGMPIGRYDQWMRLLFIHEYTHILQFEHTPWVINQANSALGGLLLSGFPQLPIDITLALPDLLSNAPSFFTEGLAVHTESTFTPGGRGVEGEFDMVRRMAFLDGTVPELDQVWGRYLLDWPVAGYEYTWGTSFIQSMVKHHGEDAPIRVLKAYSTLPWLGFDVAVSRALGESSQQVWDRMKAELADKYKAEALAHQSRQQMAANGGSAWAMPKPKDVTASGRYHRHPQWMPDGTLVYAEALKNKSPRLLKDKLDGSEPQVVMGKSTRSSVAVAPDGEKIYYETDTQDTVKQLNSFRDLFVYDLKAKKSTRLTHKARTFAPALSPDGKRLVAVTSGEGKSGLAIFDTAGKQLNKWTYDNNEVQFGNPAWSPDGSLLAVAVWQAGSRDLVLVDPETGKQTILWKDAAADFYPSWSPDGEYLVFTSDRTGTFNLHAYHLPSRKLSQLTDVLGGAFDPVVSPDGATLAFVNYTGRGYDIQTMPFVPGSAPVVTTLAAAPAALELPEAAKLPTAESLGVKPYNPLNTFVPSTWFPLIGQDEWGQSLRVYSYWQDVLREHFLVVGGGYGLFSQRLNYDVFYRSNQSLPQWEVNVSEYPQTGRFLISETQAGDIWQWNKSARLAFHYPGLRNPMFDPPPITGDNWTVGLNTEQVNDYAFQLDPQPGASPSPLVKAEAHQPFPLVQDEGVSNSVYVQWLRATAYKLPYDYGPMSGQITSLGLEQGVPALGGTQTFTRAWADHRFYTPLPWGEKHSLGVRTTAGALYGRNGEFYYSLWRAPFGYQPLSTINRWDLQTTTSYNNRYVMLRGYPFLLGNRNMSLGLEYRFPLAEVLRGWGGAPVFLNRVYGVGFLDSGFFWGIDPNEIALPTLADFKSGAGFELRAQTTMFQSVPIDVRVGVAQALTTDSQGAIYTPQFNFGLGTTF